MSGSTHTTPVSVRVGTEQRSRREPFRCSSEGLARHPFTMTGRRECWHTLAFGTRPNPCRRPDHPNLPRPVHIDVDQIATRWEGMHRMAVSDVLDWELQVGGVCAAGVDDVLSAVGADVLADRGHQGAEEVAGADDEAQLFAGMKRETDW